MSVPFLQKDQEKYVLKLHPLLYPPKVLARANEAFGAADVSVSKKNGLMLLSIKGLCEADVLDGLNRLLFFSRNV